MSVRTRFAPSPTGFLHIGNFRTAVFAYLTAKHAGGQFLLRIEDTDQSRAMEGSVEHILETFAWLGLEIDEGVVLEDGQISEKGALGPYTQSRRLPIYQSYAEQLIEQGDAYPCFCTSERLEELRSQQAAAHQPPHYDQRCRGLSKEEVEQRMAAGEPYVIRHAIPENQTIIVPDLIRGDITFQSNDLDDYVLLKSDGFPTYHLASVVDDHLMEISHVHRAEEWIPSAPKHILLYQALGWEPPLFAHLPTILAADGKAKLSKRAGAEPLLSYRDRGYLPEAVLNTMAFIGWSPGTEEEFFTKEELIKRFTIERVQKAGAILAADRLDYVNGWYIRHLSVEQVVGHMRPWWKEAGFSAEEKYVLAVAGAVQERIKHFDETENLTWFFFKRPEVNEALREIVVPKKSTWAETKLILERTIEFLEGISAEEWTIEVLETKTRDYVSQQSLSTIQVLWPIRAALTGQAASPGAFEMLAVLGKEEALSRLKAVAEK